MFLKESASMRKVSLYFYRHSDAADRSPRSAEENLLTNGDFSAGSDEIPGRLDDGAVVHRRGRKRPRCGGRTAATAAASACPTSATTTRALRRRCPWSRTRSIASPACAARRASPRTESAQRCPMKDTFSYSKSLYDTDGQWQELTVYGRTGEEQTDADASTPAWAATAR